MRVSERIAVRLSSTRRGPEVSWQEIREFLEDVLEHGHGIWQWQNLTTGRTAVVLGHAYEWFYDDRRVVLVYGRGDYLSYSHPAEVAASALWGSRRPQVCLIRATQSNDGWRAIIEGEDRDWDPL